jgi:alkylated DNA repair dioxygenase AlkB
MNLCGTDPAAILLAAAKDPGFRITKHLAGLEPAFKLTIPNSPNLTLLQNSPWLVPNGEIANPPAWTISFTGSGFPVRAVASQKTLTSAEVEWVKDSPTAYVYATRRLIGGPAGRPQLTESGKRFVELLTAPARPANSPQP